MLTQEDDVEIHALARRGWSVSAIARHTGRDRLPSQRTSSPGSVIRASKRSLSAMGGRDIATASSGSSPTTSQ